MARSDNTDRSYTKEEIQLRDKMRKRGMDMFLRRYDYSDGDVGKFAEKRIEAEAAIKAFTDPQRQYLGPEELRKIAVNEGRAALKWHMRRFAPKNTKITINGRTYTSLDEIRRERAEKSNIEKVVKAKDILETRARDGTCRHFSVGELKTKLDSLATKRDTLLKNGGGDSLTTRLNSAYRANLHSRRLAAAQQNRQVQDASGNGRPSGSNLVATDAYGRPVRPVDPLKNWKGPLSVKAREQLAIQHAVQEAAWRTADAQWRAENPNLVGRDLASMDRVAFMESEQAQAIKVQHKADQSILRGMNQDISKLTKSIDAANFLKSEGYQYNDEKKKWEYSIYQ